MKKAPIPRSEQEKKEENERLEELKSYEVLDTPSNESLDGIVRVAANICGCNTAIISLVDSDRLWIKSSFGFDLQQVPRDTSLCGHTILSDDLLIVEDALLDDRFFDNPYVGAKAGLRFYAGAPLISPSGRRIGALCVVDSKPKTLSVVQKELIKILSKNVMAYFEIGRKNLELNKAMKQSLDIQKMTLAGGWELDIETSETFWSPEVYDIYGIEYDTPTNKIDGISYYAEHERSKLVKHIENCITKNIPFDDVFEFYAKDGTKKWVRSIGRAKLNERAQAVKLLGTFQDVTTLIEKEDESFEKTQYLDLALEGAQLGTWDWNVIDHSFTFDRRWAEMLGLNINTVDKNLNAWRSRVHPEDLSQCFEKIRAYFRAETATYESVHRMKHSDGHWVFILERGRFSKFDKDGKPIRFSGTHQDITNVKSSKIKLSLFFEKSPFGYAFIDADHNVIEVNKKFCQISGYSIQEVKGKNLDDFSPLTYAAQDKSYFGSIKDKNFSSSYRKNLVCKDRSLVPVEIHAFRVVDDDESSGIWVVVNEISEQKQLEKQLQHKQKLSIIGELSAGIGHEINNPLAIINGYVQSMSRKFTSQESFDFNVFEGLISKITHASDRIAKIVNGLRNFSRSDERDIEDFDLLELVNESVDLIKNLYKGEGVTLINQVDPKEALAVRGNRGRLQQVVMNLIANAKDASIGKERPEIRLASKITESNVALTVEDNGDGIEEEVLAKIFDPFFTTKEINKGTGIGLSLVRTIVDEHGGTIEVDSKVGKGSKFTVTIPRSVRNEQLEQSLKGLAEESVAESIEGPIKEVMDQASDAHHVKKSKTGLKEAFNNVLSLNRSEAISQRTPLTGRVLLVDDEEGIRDILCDFFTSIGLDVTMTENGKQAYDVFMKAPSEFDMIVSDIQMPLMDGVSLLKSIRKDESISHQPKFVFITGGVSDLFGKKSDELDSYIDGYLLKPFDEDEIYEALHSLFRNKSKTA